KTPATALLHGCSFCKQSLVRIDEREDTLLTEPSVDANKTPLRLDQETDQWVCAKGSLRTWRAHGFA
ncbi:MAG: hypothetical protein CSA75_05100, partial [Sorangium cellulosum]